MTRRTHPAVASPAGILTTLVVLVLVAGAGLAVQWFVLADATRANRALAALLWLGGSAVLAFAAGGWLATRLAGSRGPGRALATGLGVGLAALLLLLLVVEVVLGEAMDFRSVGVALGTVDLPAAAAPPVPLRTPAGPDDPINEAADIARRRTVVAGVYLAVVAALLLGAAALGALAGHRERRFPAAGGPNA